MRRRSRNRLTQSRSPLFRLLQSYLKSVRGADATNRPLDEYSELAKSITISRRRFLRHTGTAALLGAMPTQLIYAATTPQKKPKVLIVGAGIAGLNCAFHLAKADIRADIYEASTRTGGRILTRTDVMGQGLTTEIGGEFIDGNHHDIIKLAKDFGLELIDRDTDPLPPAFFFEGQHHSEKQILEALLPILRAVKQSDYQQTANASKLDKLSLSQYLDHLGVSGWPRRLVETAYVTEFGAEPGELSSLSFIDLFADNNDGQINMFGESDERFKIKGGNSLLTNVLADHVKDQIQFGHRLVSIREKNHQYVAVFDIDKEKSIEVKADILVLAIPFSILRNVDIKLRLPSIKTRAIKELGYGDNTKICLGTNGRPWRDHGYNGETFADTNVQLCWDNSQLQETEYGGITVFLGGKKSKESIVKPVKTYQDDLAICYPGIDKQFNGKIDRFYWPSHPLAKGSYPFYKVGQWTSIAGEESKPVENLFFAGDHCSESSQGYMNGGAESGRMTAESILAKLKIR